jgi:hypothetical protein
VKKDVDESDIGRLPPITEGGAGAVQISFWICLGDVIRRSSSDKGLIDP